MDKNGNLRCCMRTTIIIYECIWCHLPNVNNHTLLSVNMCCCFCYLLCYNFTYRYWKAISCEMVLAFELLTCSIIVILYLLTTLPF